MPVDAVVLSAGARANDTEELASLLKLPRNAGGFFIEAHAKLRPVDFASEGIFLCGMAHSPKLISESIAQAMAAAARAGAFLADVNQTISGVTAHVDAGPLRRLPGVRPDLPLRRAPDQPGQRLGDQRGPVPGLRHLRLGMSGQGDPGGPL